MDEKELDLQKDLETVEPKPEENDTWKFDAEAPTLSDNIISNGEFEIEIPKSNPNETAPRPTKKPAPVAEAEAKSKKVRGDKPLFIAIAVALAVIMAVLVVLGSLYYGRANSDEKMTPGNTALTVGHTPVSVGMYNYYYTCISQNYLSYAAYGYYDIDTTASFDSQTTTDNDGNEITWAQKFEQDTLDQIQYITSYYEEAVKNGIELSDTQVKNIESSLSSLKDSAAAENKSINDYIQDIYGDYCGYATLEKMLEQCYIAENYYQQKKLDYTINTDEAQSYYDEHKEEYDTVGFAYLQVPFEDDGVSTLADCQKYTTEVNSVEDMKKLIPTACKDLIDTYVAQGYAEDADSCAEMLAANIEVTITANETGFLDEAIEWLFSSSSPVGSCAAFKDDENQVVYILYKTTDPVADDTMLYSVHHILITPGQETATTQQDTAYTDEEWANAEKKANDILKEYEDGKKTEFAFAALAEKYSADTESTSSGSSGLYGGLYAGTKIGQMVPTFENWSIDPARKYGDTGIVKSDYGYHIMYFVEYVPTYLYNCENAIKAEKEEEFIKSTKIKKHKLTEKKLKVAEPQSDMLDNAD